MGGDESPSCGPRACFVPRFPNSFMVRYLRRAAALPQSVASPSDAARRDMVFPMRKRTAVTVGNFDGVHRGHRALIDRARGAVGDAGRVVAIAFDPHPAAVLRPGLEPARLTGFDARAGLLRAAGVDEVFRLEPDRRLLALDAAAFLRHLQRDFDPAVMVEGGDFRFGRGRGGDIASLARIGEELGIDVAVVDDVEIALADQSLHRASSSLVRTLLSGGRVRDAALVLGRPYAVVGRVVEGDRLGRTIGFPTANLAFENAPPADGVYACIAHVQGETRAAAVNVGARPTVRGVERRVEAHLLGFDRDVYGASVALHFVGWIRDQMRMGSLRSLAAQLHRDCARVRVMMDEGAATAALAAGGRV